MNIVVLIKQTFDTEAKIQLTGDGKVNDQGVNLIMNPYDEFAVEEAIRIKEAKGGEVTIVSLGGDKAQEAVRQALAMGADKAVLVNDPALEGADHYVVAKVLAKVLEGMEYDLILTGWVAIDDQSSQVPGRLAEVLGLPQANVVTKLEVEDGKVVCHREGDGSVEVLEVPLPAVVTAQKGLNEPRYPSLKGIMQAKKKELKKVSLGDLGLPAEEAKAKVVGYQLPEARQAGKVVEGEPAETVSQLIEFLTKEAKVI
ncbi:MAG: electron transfer flavoprotein subunit beta/FixA family protein [Clostridia bacterium]|nr:electron transfer flavoprotein subunit beta/FixA family protein [Clostridia bacterium]